MSHQVTYTFLHLLIIPVSVWMEFLEAIFCFREMNVHIELWCSASNENNGLLFSFKLQTLTALFYF